MSQKLSKKSEKKHRCWQRYIEIRSEKQFTECRRLPESTGDNRHGVTAKTHAIKRHFLIWMTTVKQPTKRRCSCVLTLNYTFICVYWWTRQRIHNTLIEVDRYLRLMGDYKNPWHLDVVDRYLRRMGDKTIPDEAPSSLESFHPPWIAGIDLPQSRCCGFFVSFTNKHK